MGPIHQHSIPEHGAGSWKPARCSGTRFALVWLPLLLAAGPLLMGDAGGARSPPGPQPASCQVTRAALAGHGEGKRVPGEHEPGRRPEEEKDEDGEEEKDEDGEEEEDEDGKAGGMAGQTA